jgi:hydroxymethylpyrimidine/phosphomethylpyrimidine kinase
LEVEPSTRRARRGIGTPVALTIAGSDSGGGAGIQADLKTFHRFGVFGTSVITAITAQNTVGVTAWERVSPKLIRAQLDAVATDLQPMALKSGMLADAEIVNTVAGALEHYSLEPYVLDPVMVATSGDVLLRPDGVAAIRERLIPIATLVTPNLDEARILADFEVTTPAQMVAAGDALLSLGARAVLVKGGHLRGDEVVDVLVTPAGAEEFKHPRIDTTSLHGTGCALSSAITAHLAKGLPLREAVASSLAWVHRAIRSAPKLGSGHGPLDLFVE